MAATQLIVRAALQELEGQLLGVLISKAAAVVSDALGGAVGKLVAGGGQVAAEVVVLKADYSAMQTVTTALTGHRSRVEQASSVSWRRATSRELGTGGPGGGWREVARAVEQAVLQVLAAAFKDLGRAIATIVQDTANFLRQAITALRHTDTELAAKTDREAASDLAVAHTIGAGAKPRPGGVPLQFHSPARQAVRYGHETTAQFALMSSPIDGRKRPMRLFALQTMWPKLLII